MLTIPVVNPEASVGVLLESTEQNFNILEEIGQEKPPEPLEVHFEVVLVDSRRTRTRIRFVTCRKAIRSGRVGPEVRQCVNLQFVNHPRSHAHRQLLRF